MKKRSLERKRFKLYWVFNMAGSSTRETERLHIKAAILMKIKPKTHFLSQVTKEVNAADYCRCVAAVNIPGRQKDAFDS